MPVPRVIPPETILQTIIENGPMALGPLCKKLVGYPNSKAVTDACNELRSQGRLAYVAGISAGGRSAWVYVIPNRTVIQ